jgi:hypothetical protein
MKCDNESFMVKNKILENPAEEIIEKNYVLDK